MVSAEGYNTIATIRAVLLCLADARRDASGRQFMEMVARIRTEPEFADALAWAYVEVAWDQVAEVLDTEDASVLSGLSQPLNNIMQRFSDLPTQLAELRPQSDETLTGLYSSWENANTGHIAEGGRRNFTASKLRGFTPASMVVVNTDTGKEQVCLKLVSKRVRQDDSEAEFLEIVMVPVSMILQRSSRTSANRLIDMLHAWGDNINAMRDVSNQLNLKHRFGFDCLDQKELPESGPRTPKIIQTDTAKYTIGLFG